MGQGLQFDVVTRQDPGLLVGFNFLLEDWMKSEGCVRFGLSHGLADGRQRQDKDTEGLSC